MALVGRGVGILTAPLKLIGKLKPRRAADILVVSGVAAAALVTWRYGPANDWAMSALAYGWAPVALWITAAGFTLRVRPGNLARYWRWWGIAAGAAAVTLGLLSLIHPQFGLLSEVSLGGRWGSLLGGSPLGTAILKIAAIAVGTPLLFFPRPVSVHYIRALKRAAAGLSAAWSRLQPAAIQGVRLLFQGMRHLSPARLLGRWLGGKAGATDTAYDVLAQHLDGSGPDGEISGEKDPWPHGEPGVIPDLDAGAPAPEETTQTPAATDDAQAKPGQRWALPSVNLLSPAESRSQHGSTLDTMARLVESTLAEHGLNVDVSDIKAGPRIVRFGLVPGWVTRRGGRQQEAGASDIENARGDSGRVKVQSILTREKDLALALKTPYLRLEAPVPGEALVGLEVPSPSPSKVMLREVMESPLFKKISAPSVIQGTLPIALGQDTGGAPVVMDLAALPHLLIAGSTGSGKSVCINSVVASLLLTKPPDQLRMMMVDPKRVELTPFNGIPHLVAPVIVDVNEVSSALRALMREMMRRYHQMEEAGARNIAGFHAKTKEPMPYLVLFVDELADLMMTGGFEVEQNLIRLAQLGRATGIHLVLATQRPSVTVVTGLLKANIVSRVAFAVASQVDSRVILDTVGAEKLLGKGDMLLLNNDSPKPRRVQGTLVYDQEIDKLVEFWINQKGPPLPEFNMDLDDALDEEDLLDDDMWEEARDLALGNPHMSASYLERRLKIGQSRARQLIEALEEEGLVIPA
jgi:S-DNA-T family DNA segregation ATPase FtsK/SpoIIIE